MAANGPILTLSDVQFRWSGKRGFTLSIPAFSVARGETVLLLGESGSGKSTLLSLIGGTVQAQSGTITIDGTDITALPARQRDRFRAEKIGMIFQQFNLLPFGSVRDNILLPLRFAPNRRATLDDQSGEAARLCTGLGLSDDVLGETAGNLSVGQQQRVAVARAMIGRPPIVIADEPTSALDANSQAAFLDLLFAQVQSYNTSLLMVSHDPRLGSRFDRVVQLSEIAQSERVTS